MSALTHAFTRPEAHACSGGSHLPPKHAFQFAPSSKVSPLTMARHRPEGSLPSGVHGGRKDQTYLWRRPS